jgi:hypothetical protein
MLKKSGLLTLHRGSESFVNLGGLSSLKDLCKRAMRRDAGRNCTARARHFASVSAWLRQKRLRQGAGQRDGPADATWTSRSLATSAKLSRRFLLWLTDMRGSSLFRFETQQQRETTSRALPLALTDGRFGANSRLFRLSALPGGQ